MNGDGSNLRKITSYTRYALASFSVSPDGGKLAYLDGTDWVIHIMDWNGSNRRQVNEEAANVQAVQITNDGTVMAFMRESQNAKLRVFYPDGSLINLEHFGAYTTTEVGMGIASMTPSAKRVALSVARPLSTEQGRTSQIWISDIKPSSIGDAPTLTASVQLSKYPKEIDPGPLMMRVFSHSKNDRILVVDLEGMEARKP